MYFVETLIKAVYEFSITGISYYLVPLIVGRQHLSLMQLV